VLLDVAQTRWQQPGLHTSGASGTASICGPVAQTHLSRLLCRVGGGLWVPGVALLCELLLKFKCICN